MDCCNFYEHTQNIPFLSHFLCLSLSFTVFYSQLLDDDYFSLCSLYLSLPPNKKKTNRMRDAISCICFNMYIQSTLNKFDKEETWTMNESAQWLLNNEEKICGLETVKYYLLWIHRTKEEGRQRERGRLYFNYYMIVVNGWTLPCIRNKARKMSNHFSCDGKKTKALNW